MMPAERCLQDANAGISDGEIGRIRGMSRFYPNLVLVDEPIIESRDFVAFELYLFLHQKNAEVIPGIEGALRAMKSDGSFYGIRSRVLSEILGE